MRRLYRFEAMTTPCELTLITPDKPAAERCAAAVLEEAKRLEKKYSYYDPASLLYRLNARESSRIDAETRTILQRAIAYYGKTDHLFDITIATIKELYRHATSLEALQQQIGTLRPYVGCEHLRLKKDQLLFDNPHTKIDLGGFVKELAVDNAVKRIKKAKIAGALINFGGDVYALGRREDGSKFRIGINDPTHPDRHVRFIEIENEAVTTSASNERFYTVEGERFSHILSTGAGQHDILSVSVISPGCVESGVYSTALMLDPGLPVHHEVFMVRRER